jgi:uncharacterized protein YndB with AHSA1/START domain
MPSKANANEIKLTRVYKAPVKAVWDAWIDPKQVGQWWGPRGFTLTTEKKDVRTGGRWVYTMHGPDGTDYPNDTYYHEVKELKHLDYDHGASEGRPPLFRVTVDFTDLGGETKMDMTMTLPTAEAAAETKMFIKQADGDSTWDRLAEYLDKVQRGKETFVINRSFETPLEHMFEVWTEPKHFSKWLPPTGFHMKFLRAEIKPGGSTFYVMGNDAGLQMYGRASYREIRKPDRLVYTQQFCDEKENITRHPFAPTWPETMLTTVTLSAEGPNDTRITVEWEPYGNPTSEEVNTFIQSRAGMTQGWTGSFDKLEEYLTQRP